ncbi:hypothetical protein ACCE15_19145 [Pseudomonas parafulva]|uniref:hypothetical protein n=1 Tax=Pseudomonas parafulva TaxID=157782 RepID=UPI0035642CF7
MFPLQKIKQEKIFKETFGAELKDLSIKEIGKLTYENETIRQLTNTFDPAVHSINAFFTLFFVHDHCYDRNKDLGFCEILWRSEDARVIYAGASEIGDEREMLHCGFQSKEFYPLSLFMTEHDLWPDASDVRLQKDRKLKGRLTRPIRKLLRRAIAMLSNGRFCSTPYVEKGKPVRGYKNLLSTLQKHGREDLIELCEKYNEGSTGAVVFPLALRAIADYRAKRLMSLSADESLRLGMEAFYKGKYKRSIQELTMPVLRDIADTLISVIKTK